MDPLKCTGIYEIADPIFRPLGMVCFGTVDPLIAVGVHPLLALGFAGYLYFGTMMAPLVVLKWLCPNLYRKEREL